MDYNILDFGAVADGQTLCTAPIQAAIDACHSAGGGRVFIPAGGEFYCGGLVLKSHVDLHFEDGARIKASPEERHYTHIPGTRKHEVIYAGDADDITIDGRGTITGNGQADWGHYWGISYPLGFRVGGIFMENCTNVRVYDITIMYSDWYAIHIKLSEDVWISRVRVFNNYFHLNSDGIDPDSSRNVTISDCHVVTGDDCICPKSSTPGRPMENLTVTNCVLKTSCAAIKLGTTTHDIFRDCRFSNITIEDTDVGCGIYMRDGGLVERVSFDNISYTFADVENRKTAIPMYIDVDRRSENVACGVVRDVSFTNWHINGCANAVLQGSATSHIENLTLSNISFRVPKASDPSIRMKSFGGKRSVPDDGRDFLYVQKPAYIAVANVDGLTARDITVTMDEPASGMNMSALYLDNVADKYLSNIRRFGCAVPDALSEVFEEGK